MKGARAELAVGVFALLVLAVLGYMTFRVGEFTFGEKEGFVVYAYFRNTAGLDEKTRVKIAGVDAGVVERIELEGGRAKVTARMYPGVRLYSDAGASIRATGLLGEKYLEVTTGSEEPRMEDGGTIRNVTEIAEVDQLVRNLSQISARLMEMLAEFGQEDIRVAFRELVLNLRDVSADMKYVLAQNREKLGEIVDRVNAISAHVEELVVENKDPLTRTVSNVEIFSQSLRDEGPELLAKLNKVTEDLDALLSEAGPQFTTVAEKAGKTMESLTGITNKIEHGEGTFGKLVHDDALYDSLTNAASGLERTLGTVERFRTFVTFRGDYLTKVDETKGTFYLTLQPRADKYYIVGVISDPVGKIEVTETTTNGVFEREEKIEDRIEFTAHYAKRYADTALRLGMTESTFGLGADQFFQDDRLILSMDAWDFGEREEFNDHPHLRIGVDYFLFKNLFIAAGYDNVLNSGRRGAFFGGGLRFEDEDLKYLLGSAPSFSVN